MSKNIRIVLVGAPDSLPSFYKDTDGLFSFDLRQGTNVAITKQIDEATEVGKIRQDTVKNFDIPATKKNRAIIGQLGNPQAFNTLHNIPFQVKIIVGDYILPEQFARVVGMSDKGGFELEISGDSFGWIKPISNQKLSDIELGTFDFTEANITSAQANDFEYTDGGLIVNFPLVNYGAWPLGDKVQLEDFRFWFNVLGLLQEGFCQIGWKFVCPILETSYGRRLWTYLLKENFRESSVSLTGLEFMAERSTPLDILNKIGCLPFDDDFTPPNGDPGNNYNPITGIYQAQVVADFFFEGSVTVVGTGVATIILQWIKTDQFGNTTVFKIEDFRFQNAGTFPIASNVSDVELFSTDQFCLLIISLAQTTSFDLDTGSKIWNEVKSADFERGDTIILNQLFAENYRTMDLLKGVVHLFNLKPETNNATKTVSFYPENGANDFFFEGTQEAFFLPNSEAKDWTDKIQCESLIEDLQRKELKEEYLFAFAKSTDEGNALLLRDLPLHSELIQQPQGDFEEGRTENFNPFFEPTRNAIDRTIAFPLTNPTAPYMPHIWDSEPNEGELLPEKPSTNIKPRICLAYGYGFVALTSTAAGQVNPTFGQYTNEDGTIQNEYLLFSQVLPDGIAVVAATTTEDEMIVYGSDIRTDLVGNYEHFYEETLRTLYFGFPIEFLILLNLNDLVNFSNRDRIFFRYYSKVYGDLSLFARVVKITDFLINRNLTTPIQLLPKTNFFNLCQ
jgi:hypothetical protein